MEMQQTQDSLLDSDGLAALRAGVEADGLRPQPTTQQPAQSSLSNRPLAPPRGSPARIYKEPIEFIRQQERQLEREERASQRIAYRQSLVDAGHKNVCLIRPTVKNTMDGDPPPPFQRGPLQDIFCCPPFLIREPKSPSLLQKPFRAKTDRPEVAHYLEDARATIGGEKARMSKETWGNLQGWSRGAQGNPWTYRQLCAEMEGDIQHRKARDYRAKCGQMGPAECGKQVMGRRDLIRFDRTAPFVSTVDNGFNASSCARGEGSDGAKVSPASSMARSCSSLPAITHSASSPL